ncbi:hypothetical protein B0H13DRAFT_1892303 [Mycena leptocephala]|nr:hypothetical protein B0H13DRAFT_1892303 [Mycena leptocephala]
MAGQNGTTLEPWHSGSTSDAGAGGIPRGATMAIDPRLSALSSPSSLSSSIPPQRPIPHPTYTGSIFGKSNPVETVGEESEAPSTTNVGGFNFPAISTGSYKPSHSFEALHRAISGSEVPLARTPICTPLCTPTVATGAQAGSATKSVAVLAAIIGAPLPGPSAFGASQPTTFSSIMGISSNSSAKRPPVVLPGSHPAARLPPAPNEKKKKPAPAAKTGKKVAVAKAGKMEATAMWAQKTAEVTKRGGGRPGKDDLSCSEITWMMMDLFNMVQCNAREAKWRVGI